MTVRLDELTPAQRHLVLALIRADEAHKPEPPHSPEKPSGAAHSKEQRT